MSNFGFGVQNLSTFNQMIFFTILNFWILKEWTLTQKIKHEMKIETSQKGID